MNALASNSFLRASVGRRRLFLALLAALAAPLAGCAAGVAGSAAAGGTAGGYVLSPADRAVIAALPAPRPAGIDLSGACRDTEPVFADERAKAQWTAPSYGLPLRLWAISHVGTRAGTSAPPCADIELATRLWQSAIGSPITGRWSERDVTEFVRIVDARDPRYAQASQRRRANAAAGVVAAQGSGMAQETLGQRPASERAVADESPFAGSRKAEGSVEGRVSQVRLENTLTLFGSSYGKVSQQLSGALCKPQGQTILCVKEDPCFNFQTLHDSGGRTGTRLRGGGSPHGPQSGAELGQGLMEMLNHMNPRVRQAQQSDNATRLAACRARYRASPEAGIELSFAGQPVKKAILSFEGGRYSRLEIDNRGSNVEESQKFGEYSNAINRWLIRRLGEPQVTQITNTERWVETQCYGLSCTSMPFDKVNQHHAYTWRTSSVRAHQEGNVFDIDSMR